MKIFLVKLSFFILVLISFLFIVDSMIAYGLKTSNYREVSKWNEVVEGGINAEILIIGSSRALVHFDCSQIEKKTGFKCYNLGFDGTNYPLQMLMLDLYLSKNIKPKFLIWSLDLHTFKNMDEFYGFEQLIPYLRNEYVAKMLDINKTIPNFYYYAPIIRYSFNSKMKLVGIASFIGLLENQRTLDKGYKKQDKIWDNKFESFKLSNPQGIRIEFDINLFEGFIEQTETLMSNNIEISLVFTPMYKEGLEIVVNHKEILSYYSELGRRLEIDFYDYSTNRMIDQKYNFYNSNHLNKKGVDLFMFSFIKEFNLRRHD